jgi:hypothetical protein
MSTPPAIDPPRAAVFILSTGRTGTMALAHNLDNAYDEVTAFHEPKPVRHFRLLSNRIASGRAVPTSVGVKLLKAARWRRMRVGQGAVYVESNWYLYGLVDALATAFGKVKVLHVVRDPRTIVPSFINYGSFSGIKGAATRFLPYWWLKPEQCVNNPLGRTWADLSPAERASWHWTAVNGHIDRAIAAAGATIEGRRVLYEDLFAPAHPAMTDLLHWIGLPVTAERTAQLQRQRANASPKGGSSWQRMDPAERDRVLQMCGPLMQTYGYDAATEPRDA